METIRFDNLVGQIVRFGVMGVLLTFLVSLIYWLLNAWFEIDPRLTLVIGTSVATIVGYFGHSFFSFKGYGARDKAGIRFVRFSVANVVGLVLNFAYVVVMVKQLELPIWSPIPLFFTITPTVTFLLNRVWVFK